LEKGKKYGNVWETESVFPSNGFKQEYNIILYIKIVGFDNRPKFYFKLLNYFILVFFDLSVYSCVFPFCDIVKFMECTGTFNYV